MSAISLLSGSYSGPGGEGLRLLSFDTDTGALSLIRSYPGTPDASWIAFEAVRSVVYITDEMAEKVGAFALAGDRSIATPLGYQPTGAKYPCYLRISPEGDKLAVANYGDDSVPVFDLDAGSGALKANPQVLRGVKPAELGHAHWTQWSPEGDRLYMVDLGHDEVRFFAQDKASGRFGVPQTAFKAPQGAGPRHLAFHPKAPFAYLFTEYAVTLTALKREADGRLTEINTVRSLPDGVTEGETGTPTGAHVQVSSDGRFVYASNRGHNSLTVFALAEDGSAKPIQNISTGGNWPRFFLLIGNFLIVANQLSDDLTVFRVAADGTLAPAGVRFALEKPVALLPI